MRRVRFIAISVSYFALTLAGGGCGKRPPPITPVEGTLMLNNQPLPFAFVEFYPELTQFGAEMNSSAVTDEQGRFTLTCHVNGKPGAAVATHRVVVIEGPLPQELRGMDSQSKLAEHRSKLKNRPIPATYGNYSQTPLRVEVRADQREYELRMQR